MNFKLKSNNGKTVVLSQNHAAKIALCFSENYHLVNAVNLACLSKFVYAPYQDIEVKFKLMNSRYRVNLWSDDSVPVSPFLSSYQGKKAFFAEGMTKILAEESGPTIIDTQGFHYNDDEYNVIIFRGTLGFSDLAADIYAPKIDFLAGKVHQGFYENFRAVRDPIFEILEKPENKKCKTIIAGHSLGGALSTLAAASISTQFLGQPCGQVMAYTFGAPRVGEKQWVDYFSTTRRFIHHRHRRKGDPITMLPPHHSSMRIPTIKDLGAEVAQGSNICIAILSSILASDKYSEAFMHHGQGILLSSLGPNGVDLVMGNLPAEVLVMDGTGLNSKEVLLARELWQIVKGFRKGIGPHSMADYVSELTHFLKEAIEAWDKDPSSWLDKAKKSAQYWQAEVDRLKKERLQEAMKLEPVVAPPSSTVTSNSRNS